MTLTGDGKILNSHIKENSDTVRVVVIDSIFNHKSITMIAKLPNLEIIHIQCWSKFNQPIKFPPSLKYFYCSSTYNQPINDLPNGMICVVFGDKFNQPLERMPPNMKMVNMEACSNYSHSLSLVNLSIGLRHLKLGFDINPDTILPAGIKSVEFKTNNTCYYCRFSGKCNSIFNITCMSHCIFEPFWSNLPVSIESLILTEYPPYKTNKVYLNEGIKYLKIYKFDGNIHIPCSVTVLSIEFANLHQVSATAANYDYSIPHPSYPSYIEPHPTYTDIYASSATIPDTVKNLTIKINYFDNQQVILSAYRINKFPAYLKKLTIIANYYTLLDNLNVETIKLIRVPEDYPYFKEIKAMYPDAIIKQIKFKYIEHEHNDHSDDEYDYDADSDADDDAGSDACAEADTETDTEASSDAEDEARAKAGADSDFDAGADAGADAESGSEAAPGGWLKYS